MQTLREERKAAEAVARAIDNFNPRCWNVQVRTEPLGMDRDFNTFWRFAFDERKIRIFVHNVKNKTWQYYSRAKEIKLLMILSIEEVYVSEHFERQTTWIP